MPEKNVNDAHGTSSNIMDQFNPCGPVDQVFLV